MFMKKKVGKRIQMIRLQKNITQEQMADSLCISTSAYCKLEYGETDLTITRIKRLSEIFNIPILELTNSLLKGLDSQTEPENICPTEKGGNFVIEKMISDLVGQNKDFADKMVRDLLRIEDKLDNIESRVNKLENFHLKE